MSTPLYLLAALGLGLGLAGLILLVDRLIAPSVAALHRRWLEWRFSRRPAHGYDGEPRSIEAALAARLTRAPLSTSERALAALMFFVAGIALLGVILPEEARPLWTRRASSLVIVALGLQMASGIGRTADTDSRIIRIFGLILAILGLLMFAYDLSRLQRGLP